MTDFHSILKRYWGYDDFRSIQLDIIRSIADGNDTMGLMPTGGGKSLTFQVPALAMDGVCIVVTPLIALMKDQVLALRKRNIKAAAIYSGMPHYDILQTLENAIFGAVKILYVSPERLQSELFQAKLRHMKVSFITVDEAHCISEWGYDFRPSYLQIIEIRKLCPDAPVLALTATATPEVVDDIQQKLSLGKDTDKNTKKFKLFKMSFERKNLAYIVKKADDKRDTMLHLLQTSQGATIVYARSRKRTREFAEMLQQAGISATYYHAGLDTITRDEHQLKWLAGRCRVIVATNAFGMGIDKPDVRMVIHIDCPSSVEAYFQEAGRAGRDGKPAQAILLYNKNDIAKLNKRISDTYPEKEYIRTVYNHLAYYYQIAVGSGYRKTFEFNIEDFSAKFHHFPIQVYSALEILDHAGYIEYIEEQETKARVKFMLGRDELYRLHGNPPNEERVITALLRSYGGLFVDYAYIDESIIARDTQLTQVQVYLTLKELAMKNIISFIPQKRTPYIRYRQRREDAEHLILPPEVYDNLRSRFIHRINEMAHYASSNEQCRSRLLLNYFGETHSDECGQCDVCLSQQTYNKISTDNANRAILTLLNDRKKHHVTELRNIPLPYEEIDGALKNLLSEEYISQQDGYIYKV